MQSVNLSHIANRRNCTTLSRNNTSNNHNNHNHNSDQIQTFLPIGDSPRIRRRTTQPAAAAAVAVAKRIERLSNRMPALHSDNNIHERIPSGQLTMASFETSTTTTTARRMMTTTTATTTTTASSKPICSRCSRAIILIASTCLLATLTFYSQQADAASANRINMHQVSRQTNQFFLNEFCDLESKTLRSAKKLKQTSDTNSLFLTSKNTLSSVRVLPQKQQVPSAISFGFGSSAAQQAAQVPIFKQLNCSIIVVAPKSHGLLVTVNSIGLPKNLTKLGITLNYDSSHAQTIHLEGETTSANYLLTQPQSSKIAINLQSFQPIDWSHVSFDILFTVYKKANNTGCPNKKWFDCGDNICVPSSLVCDKNLNCPNGNDEMIFYRCYSPLFWSIAASCSLALLLVGLMILVIVFVRRTRRHKLSKLNSFSNNQLAADTDLIHEDNLSKLDLTHAEQIATRGAANNSYLASNLYLGGFENPVWTNGTLTKQQAMAGVAQQQQQHQHQQQHQQQQQKH